MSTDGPHSTGHSRCCAAPTVRARHRPLHTLLLRRHPPSPVHTRLYFSWRTVFLKPSGDLEACSHCGLGAEPGCTSPTSPSAWALAWTMDWMTPHIKATSFPWEKPVTFRAYWTPPYFLTGSFSTAFPWALVLVIKLLSPRNSVTFPTNHFITIFFLRNICTLVII